MLVADLIADHALHLELATPSTDAELAEPIDAVVTSESLSPAGFLEPRALLLTTGIGMNFENAQIWEGYVERLLGAEVSALCFAIGPAHKALPTGLVAAATARGLPVLAVPPDVSFLQLQQTITQTLAGERYWLSRRAWALASQCITIASRQGSVDELLAAIESHTQLAVGIFDDTGAHFAGHLTTPAGPALDVSIGGEATWHFHADLAHGDSSAEHLRVLFSPVVTVLSMALARQFETVDTSSPLPELLRGSTPGAALQLAAALGDAHLIPAAGLFLIRVDAATPIRCNLVAHRLARRLSADFRLHSFGAGASHILVAMPLRPTAIRPLLAPLLDQGVGDSAHIWGPAHDEAQLMLGYRFLLQPPPRPGVHAVPTPGLQDAVALIPPVLHDALAATILRPVHESPDAARHLATLRAILTTPNATAAAAQLGVHRNTFHKDRARLEARLGRDLNSPYELALCAIAVSADSL